MSDPHDEIRDTSRYTRPERDRQGFGDRPIEYFWLKVLVSMVVAFGLGYVLVIIVTVIWGLLCKSCLLGLPCST